MRKRPLDAIAVQQNCFLCLHALLQETKVDEKKGHLMISGVQDFYYIVCDVAKAIAFYNGVLGLEVVEETEHWAALNCFGTRIGLHWSGGKAIPQLPADSHGAQSGGTLTLRSDDIAAARKHLEKHDIRILGEDNAPWGHMLVFQDPDGNVLKLMNPRN